MEAEAALLQAFCSVPALGRGWCTPAGGAGVQVTLQLSQRNLPANTQRKFLVSFALSEASLEAGHVDAGLPVEQKDVVLMAPSPSGGCCWGTYGVLLGYYWVLLGCWGRGTWCSWRPRPRSRLTAAVVTRSRGGGRMTSLPTRAELPALP